MQRLLERQSHDLNVAHDMDGISQDILQHVCGVVLRLGQSSNPHSYLPPPILAHVLPFSTNNGNGTIRTPIDGSGGTLAAAQNYVGAWAFGYIG
jgi:hypothetical protein